MHGQDHGVARDLRAHNRGVAAIAGVDIGGTLALATARRLTCAQSVGRSGVDDSARALPSGLMAMRVSLRMVGLALLRLEVLRLRLALVRVEPEDLLEGFREAHAGPVKPSASTVTVPSVLWVKRALGMGLISFPLAGRGRKANRPRAEPWKTYVLRICNFVAGARLDVGV